MSDAASLSRLTVNVLGELQFVPATPELTALNDRAREVLVLLVLAEESQWTVEQLARALRADPPLVPSNVHHHFKALRDAGVPIEQRGARPTRYWLDRSRVTSDAWTFVAGVPDASAPADIHRLAALWRDDPRRAHPEVGDWRWGKVRRARDTLVHLIEELNPDDRSDDATLRRIAPHLVADSRVPRRVALPRILVVDDLHAETVAHQAMSHAEVECDRIESFDEWQELKETVDVSAEYQAALVDLHLNADSAFNDKLGLGIISYLRDHTDIPVAAVSSASGAGTGPARNRLRAEYRLVDIVDKGEKNRHLNGIPEVVRLLLSDRLDCRKVRLETWLMHAEREIRRMAGDGEVSLEDLKRIQQEYKQADAEMRYGDLDTATELVHRFCDKWLPQGDCL